MRVETGRDKDGERGRKDRQREVGRKGSKEKEGGRTMGNMKKKKRERGMETE